MVINMIDAILSDQENPLALFKGSLRTPELVTYPKGLKDFHHVY
jgi:hypothetical protein